MSNDTVVSLGVPARVCDPLTELVRTGARGLIEAAVTAEFEEYLSAFVQEKLPDGRQRVVRSGHLPERKVLTGLGEVDVRVPKARSRSGSPEPFRSSLVPPYVRRCASLDAAIAWLYLHGVSTGQRRQAVAALVGEQGARGLSANVVSRLERGWDEEYRQWCRRRLDDDWVYLWADGIYSGLRGERERLCVLVVIGVNARGEKHFLAIEDGVRESTEMSGAKGTRSGAGPSTEPRSPATPMTPGAPHGCPGVLHELRPSRAARLFGIEPRVPRRRALPRWLMSRPLPSQAPPRARDDGHGREPGQDRHPRGGRPCKRACGEPEPKAQSKFTDPRSQIMNTGREGFQPCRNAQMAADGEHRIIVATEVGPPAGDQGRPVGMLDRIDGTLGAEPAVVPADAGYRNEPDRPELESRGIDAHAAPGRAGKSRVAVGPARLPATQRMGSCVPMTNLGPLGGMLCPLADRGPGWKG